MLFFLLLFVCIALSVVSAGAITENTKLREELHELQSELVQRGEANWVIREGTRKFILRERRRSWLHPPKKT